MSLCKDEVLSENFILLMFSLMWGRTESKASIVETTTAFWCCDASRPCMKICMRMFWRSAVALIPTLATSVLAAPVASWRFHISLVSCYQFMWGMWWNVVKCGEMSGEMWWTSTIGLGTSFLVQFSIWKMRSFESSIRLDSSSASHFRGNFKQALGCLLFQRSLLPPGKREGWAAKKSPRSRSISLQTIAPLNQLGSSWFMVWP